jgi:hypothetical protein
LDGKKLAYSVEEACEALGIGRALTYELIMRRAAALDQGRGASAHPSVGAERLSIRCRVTRFATLHQLRPWPERDPFRLLPCGWLTIRPTRHAAHPACLTHGDFVDDSPQH